MTEELMTREEAAEYLGICLSTFDRQVLKNIPFFRIGRIIRIRKIDLDNYIRGK